MNEAISGWVNGICWPTCYVTYQVAVCAVFNEREFLPARALSSSIREIDSQMTSAISLKSIRLIHHYAGVFFAATILFFSITGGLQMFGLHETSRGSSYVPLAILVHLSQLHKKGTPYLLLRKPFSFVPGKVDGQKADAPKPDAPKSPAPSPALPASNPLLMKLLFIATALALLISTCTGLAMSWKYARRKAAVAGVLLAGIVCPLIFLLL